MVKKGVWRYAYFTLNINFKAEMFAFIEAIKIFGARLKNYNARLTFTDSNDKVDYRLLNSSTINYLDEIFNNPNYERVKDSNDEILENILNIKSIKVEFKEKAKGKRIIAGFFPYLNISDINLKKFAIFNNITDNEINNSCLLQAFKYSNILSDEELNMLTSFIKTRYIPKSELKIISQLFKLHINVRIYYDNNKTSHDDIGLEYKELRTIKLIIFNNHYILNEKVQVTEYYIKHYKEINKNIKFINHPRKYMLKRVNPNRHEFAKEGINIVKLINLLIEEKLLVPMCEKQLNTLEWSFKPKNITFELTSRPIIVPNMKNKAYKLLNKVKQTTHFFGYKPNEDEVEYRLNELQQVINKLKLSHFIDVSLYYKFSELMQKIMYEYGCFDNVDELSGAKASNIRKECIFPKIQTYNNKPLYLKDKLYYIDLNGAYMSAIKGIPTTNGVNTKIKELINILYNYRIEAKKNNNDKLATTLKFLMNSCWGYSIQRPKLFKHKFTNNIKNYIETYSPYVIKYKYLDNNETLNAGYVDTINPIVVHFSYPQFAKSVLDEYKNIMNKIKSLVNVLYENIDAILIREEDYYKLLKLGYIGEELGKFKVEKIFKEIAIKSPRKYIAKLDNDELYYHCVNSSINYETFIKEL